MIIGIEKSYGTGRYHNHLAASIIFFMFHIQCLNCLALFQTFDFPHGTTYFRPDSGS